MLDGETTGWRRIKKPHPQPLSKREGLGVRLQLPYNSLHLLTKPDGISLRDIDYTIEGIRDYEERELRRIAKLHVFGYLLAQRAVIVYSVDDIA